MTVTRDGHAGRSHDPATTRTYGRTYERTRTLTPVERDPLLRVPVDVVHRSAHRVPVVPSPTAAPVTSVAAMSTETPEPVDPPQPADPAQPQDPDRPDERVDLVESTPAGGDGVRTTRTETVEPA